MTPRDPLATLLGLPPEVLVAPTAVAALPELTAIEGLSTPRAVVCAEDRQVWVALVEGAELIAVAGAVVVQGDLGSTLRASVPQENERDQAAVLHGWAAGGRTPLGPIVLNGRAGAAVRWREPDGERVVVAVDGRVERFDLVDRWPAPPRRRWPPAPLQLLGSAPRWLAARASPLLASPSPLAVAAGVAVLGRLWSPEDGARALAAALAGDAGPVDLARGWVAAIDRGAQGELVARAALEAAACHEALDRISAADHPEQAAGALYELADRRDALESVRWLLAPGLVDPLAERLDPLDREVWIRWSELPPLRAERWRAEVAWREPRAWWGRLRTVPEPRPG